MKKLFRQSVTWFVIVYIMVSLGALVMFVTVPRPFAGLYEPGHGALYVAMNSLLFLPVFLLAGFVLGRALRMAADRKSLIGTGICAIVLTVPLVVVSIMDDHSIWMMYTVINPPYGYTMMEFSSTADYLTWASLLFTAAPPLVFLLGIYLQQNRVQGKAQVLVR
jgi:hypothetical protein